MNRLLLGIRLIAKSSGPDVAPGSPRRSTVLFHSFVVNMPVALMCPKGAVPERGREELRCHVAYASHSLPLPLEGRGSPLRV